MPELEHETGRAGAQRVKRLLEATLRFNLPYDAYQHAERVRLEMLTGIFETYDLNGDYLDEDGHGLTRIYVESKNVEGAAGQSTEFKRFLAQAYSATKLCLEKDFDPKYEFMWATTCPWKGDGFRRVAVWQEVRDAALWDATRDVDAVVIGGRKLPRAVPDVHIVDEDVARTVANRLWVWVISDRHEQMTISRKMRGWVYERLGGEDVA